MKRKKLTKARILRVRVTEYEMVKLNCHAGKHGKSISQIIRDYIRRLPAIKMSFKDFSEYYEITTGQFIEDKNLNIPLLTEFNLTLEEWLKMVQEQPETIPLDEWSELAGW